MAGTAAELSLRRNSAAEVKVDGAERLGEKLKVVFPQGSGFVTRQVRISWGR
jgi:hypothetical protein